MFRTPVRLLSFSLILDLARHSTPLRFVSGLPGATWDFQAWRRFSAMGTPASEPTDGLKIAFS